MRREQVVLVPRVTADALDDEELEECESSWGRSPLARTIAPCRVAHLIFSHMQL